MLRRLHDLDRRFDGPAPAELRASARVGGPAARRKQLAEAQERVFADLARRTQAVLAQRRFALRHKAGADPRLAGLCRALADSRRQALRWRGESAAP